MGYVSIDYVKETGNRLMEQGMYKFVVHTRHQIQVTEVERDGKRNVALRWWMKQTA